MVDGDLVEDDWSGDAYFSLFRDRITNERTTSEVRKNFMMKVEKGRKGLASPMARWFG